MITEVQYEILKEVKRCNDNTKRNIPFREITSLCSQCKWVKGYLSAHEVLTELINKKYITSQSSLECLVITQKGRRAMYKYEHRGVFSLVKKFLWDVGVSVGGDIIIKGVIAIIILIAAACGICRIFY